MSLESTLARIAAIETSLYPQAAPSTGGISSADPASGASGASSEDFSQLLGEAAVGSPSSSPTLATGSSISPLGIGSCASSAPLAMVAAARTQVGQHEEPMGSNESARISEYRSAVQGAVVGPWCADFASWSAAQAGIPLGEHGEGFQSVGALWSWAEASGRAVPAATGTPEAGDLIVWGAEHVGIIESVEPDGTIHTIEGNSENQVAQRTYPPGTSGATGYVKLG
jgi:hypothetical protein